MSARASYTDFVEDELLRAPIVLDQVVDEVLSRWQRSPVARLEGDPARVVMRHRHELVADAVKELRRLVQAETAGVHAHRPAAAAAALHTELSLVVSATWTRCCGASGSRAPGCRFRWCAPPPNAC